MKIVAIGVLFFGCILNAFSEENTSWSKNPNFAALSSFLVAGSAQLYDGRYQVGFSFLGTSIGSRLLYEHYKGEEDHISAEDRIDEGLQEEYLNLTTYKSDLVFSIWLNNKFLSSYDAYKSRKDKGNNGISPKDDLSDLWLAPFDWKYLSRPTTYVPMLVAAFVGSNRDSVYAIRRSSDVSDSSLYAGSAFMSEASAVGEEAFFRGYVNTEMSDNYGEDIGLWGSSLIFGLAHSGEGNQADFLTATGIGGYLGWLHQRNGYELGESVAVHYWFNFILAVAEIEHGAVIPLIELNTKF